MEGNVDAGAWNGHLILEDEGRPITSLPNYVTLETPQTNTKATACASLQGLQCQRG